MHVNSEISTTVVNRAHTQETGYSFVALTLSKMQLLFISKKFLQEMFLMGGCAPSYFLGGDREMTDWTPCLVVGGWNTR